MSVTPSASPSPLQVAANGTVDESKLPRGHCRYILLQPEIKGQRCACVCFSLNKGIPGATCDCGHLACFHHKEPEAPNDQRYELEQMKKRIQQLEIQMSMGQEDALDSVVSRINEVEENLEKSKEEFSDQIKGAYRNVNISWRSIEQADQRSQQQDQQICQIYEKLKFHDERLDSLHAGQLELRDADLSLEERIENLTETLEEEREEWLAPIPERRPRRRSTSDTSRPFFLAPLGLGAAPPDSRHRSPMGGPHGQEYGDWRGRADSSSVSPSMRQSPPASARSTGAWTVHISLLPSAEVPMPFERNTNAYQRCLSRGLHQVVAIHGRDGESFRRAIDKAFGKILNGREWMPLQAKLCDAGTLQGLPMLRQLDSSLINSTGRYDHEFLAKYCGVCDSGGTIDSLYIAMRRHTISWHTLKNLPVFFEGLEDCWVHDPLLDVDPYANDMAIDDEDRPAAGDIASVLPPLTSSLKRPLTEMSRSNSFSAGIAADGDEARVKRTRPVATPSTIVEIREIRRRGVETA
ncbi:hypothetical protein QBC42DRAFT_182577 [Cladorrhinum samala]|uniref:Uncharacterized protein n=1 Tax=Cladorrhinum samala TaxID=585594 RepID=A0AAV9HK64_9PEZI|nr:hypothetical protein QBC42DRAFT_182577 [Cladorrhinum samala]